MALARGPLRFENHPCQLSSGAREADQCGVVVAKSAYHMILLPFGVWVQGPHIQEALKWAAGAPCARLACLVFLRCVALPNSEHGRMRRSKNTQA